MAISQNLNTGGNLWEIPPIGEGSIPVRSNTITCMSVVHRFLGAWCTSLMRKTALSLRTMLKLVRIFKKSDNLLKKCSLNLVWFMNGLILFNILIIREPLNHQFSSIQLSTCSYSNLTIKFFLAWNHRPLVRWMAVKAFHCWKPKLLHHIVWVNDQVMISNAKIGSLNVLWEQGVINARHNGGSIKFFSCQVSKNGLFSWFFYFF